MRCIGNDVIASVTIDGVNVAVGYNMELFKQYENYTQEEIKKILLEQATDVVTYEE